MKKLLIGAVIGAMITAFLFVKFMPRPGPGESVVIYKDKIISGQISGQAKIMPKMPQEDGDNNQTINDKGSIKIVSPESISATNNSSDFSVSVPVRGEIKTNLVGLQFTGVTTVQREDDNLTVNTTFDPDAKETIYQEPVKTWHVGLGAVADSDGVTIGAHAQKDFPIWGSLVAFGRVEADREWRVKVGIEYSF